MPESPPEVLLQVLLYDGSRMVRQLTRFKDVAYSGTFRGDGRLVAAGGASGLVQVPTHISPCCITWRRPDRALHFVLSLTMCYVGRLAELQSCRCCDKGPC